MKVFFAPLAIAFVFALWGPWRALADPGDVPPGRLLLVEVSPDDAPAAARLVELLGQPVEQLRMAGARDPKAVHSVLLRSSATRALVLDTAARRVQVHERDGQVRTRLIEAEATPYLTAFVASELLALEPPALKPHATHETSVPRSLVARVDGQLALDVASAYTTRWLARPKLGLGLWLAPGASQRVLFALGGELVIPTAVHEDGPEGRITLFRWDAGLCAGAAIAVNAWRLVPFASGRAVITRATPASATERTQHTVGLGLGVGFRVERSLTKWLGLFLSVDVHTMLRRSAYELQGEALLQERFVMVSGDFGLVLHTREQ